MDDDTGPPHLEPEILKIDEPIEIKRRPDKSSGGSLFESTIAKFHPNLLTEDLPPVLETIIESNRVSEENSPESSSTAMMLYDDDQPQHYTRAQRKRKELIDANVTRFSLRPRKTEIVVPPPPQASAKKQKKAFTRVKAKASESASRKKQPPQLALPEAHVPFSERGNLPNDMPQLHSEASSSSSDGISRKRGRKSKKQKKKENSSRGSSKERAVPSPSTAECHVNAACPESSATPIDAMRQSQCLCKLKPYVFVNSNNNPGDLTCQALDTMDDRIIGCCNPLPASTVGLYRASTRVPYIMLCPVHVQRLLRHNCCPGCGLFCTQGKFLVCNNLHQYHKQCARPEGCLHCGELYPPKSIYTSMKSRRDPVFLPKPRVMRATKPAKMSIARNKQPAYLAVGTEVMVWPAAEPPEIEKYSYKKLLNAVRTDDGPMLLKIMNSGLNPNHIFPDLKNQTPLHIAASLGHTTIVNLLLQIGLPINLMDADQNTALHLAVIYGHLDVVKYLIKAGSSLILRGRDGMTPLHLAAKNGHADACSIILSTPSLPRRYIDTLDDGGWTALVWGAEFNHIEVVRLLLREGGDPSIRDAEQNIALHWAAYGGSHVVVDQLLSSGCDILATNAQGDTPLHIAARQDKYDCVLLLIARGAKSNIKNDHGETPFDISQLGSNIRSAIGLNQDLGLALTRFVTQGPRILSNDISRGREQNPIQCVNDVDDEPEPKNFIYVNESCFTSRINVDRTVTSMQNCCCDDNCTTGNCACTSVRLSAWYDNDGILCPEFNYNDPPMIFECNQICGCNRILCQNRVVQNGTTCRFQMFRTETRGWAVKTINAIRKGTYVCEYVGELITDSEADHRENDSYLFDLDNRDGESYCIDAHKYGNMSRFINHMCSPNLIPVDVFVEHQDLRFPRIAFFAKHDIAPNSELGYNYGEKFWVIKGKSFTCTCGWEKCMYSSETIHTTLEVYRQRNLDTSC